MLSTLTKIVQKSAKRLGRGYGSGKGSHTSSRGAKGDKVRGKVKLTDDGQKIKKSWIQRTPRLRGKNKLKTFQLPVVPVSLSQLDKWYKSGATVDQKSLSKLTGHKDVVFKIVQTGKLTKKLKIKDIKTSSSASKFLNV